MAWGLGAIAGLLALGGIGLWIALQVNSVAVLDTVDRATGGNRAVTRVAQVRLGEAPTQTLSLHRAGRTAAPAPVLLFIHGGSWEWGDPKDYGFVARSLAPEGFMVALAGYRLGEAGRYPAMLEDSARGELAARERRALWRRSRADLSRGPFGGRLQRRPGRARAPLARRGGRARFGDPRGGGHGRAL